MSSRLRAVESIRAPEFKAASQLARRSGRRAFGSYLIEGESMLKAALESGAAVQQAFIAARGETDALVNDLLVHNVETFSLAQGMLFKMLGTSYETTTWCVGVVKMPSVRLADVVAGAGRLLVMGEQIQDPRNVGVMIRTAEAAGAAAFVLTEDSADPYCRAAVRSTTGSILRLPVVSVRAVSDAIPVLKQAGYRIAGTSAVGAKSLWDADLTGKIAFLFGNETTGLSAGARSAADELLKIPMAQSVHSVNVTVAQGIVLFEYLRRRGGI